MTNTIWKFSRNNQRMDREMVDGNYDNYHWWRHRGRTYDKSKYHVTKKTGFNEPIGADNFCEFWVFTWQRNLNNLNKSTTRSTLNNNQTSHNLGTSRNLSYQRAPRVLYVEYTSLSLFIVISARLGSAWNAIHLIQLVYNQIQSNIHIACTDTSL